MTCMVIESSVLITSVWEVVAPIPPCQLTAAVIVARGRVPSPDLK